MFLTAPKNEWCCQEKAYRSLETLKNIGFSTLQDLFDVSNNQAGFYRIYMKLFWIDLVIYTSCLGITLAQPSNISLRSAWRIMQERPMFFSRRYLTWKKRSENEEHNDQQFFLCIKAGSAIYIDCRRSLHRTRK